METLPSDQVSYVAFVDFETTGLDTQKDFAVEFAAVVYEPLTRRYIKSFEEIVGTTIDAWHLKTLSEISRIEARDLSLFYNPSLEQFRYFYHLCRERFITTIVAHNAEFDRSFFDRLCQSHNLPLLEVRWMCSFKDFSYRDGIKAKSLSYLCADHGVLNPIPHRGLADCFGLFFIARQYDWNELTINANYPSIQLQAMVSYHDRQKAKDAGFRWDGSRWIMDAKETPDFQKVIETFPFRVEKVK
jgi:DNA polymerase-3 subunit epsilon